MRKKPNDWFLFRALTLISIPDFRDAVGFGISFSLFAITSADGLDDHLGVRFGGVEQGQGSVIAC